MKIRKQLDLGKWLTRKASRSLAESYLQIVRLGCHFVWFNYLHMKTSCLVCTLLGLTVLATHAQFATMPTNGNPLTVPAPTAFQVVERGENHRVWQKESYNQAPDGTIITNIQSYTDLATGMHYKNSQGQWVESKELIESHPRGAIARQGQYQVIFANNLNSIGAIDQNTPDGKRLQSNILGLGYYDSATGNTVMIAMLQNSQL